MKWRCGRIRMSSVCITIVDISISLDFVLPPCRRKCPLADRVVLRIDLRNNNAWLIMLFPFTEGGCLILQEATPLLRWL